MAVANYEAVDREDHDRAYNALAEKYGFPAAQHGAFVKGSAQGQTVRVGENNTDEAIIPLSKGPLIGTLKDIRDTLQKQFMHDLYAGQEQRDILRNQLRLDAWTWGEHRNILRQQLDAIVRIPEGITASLAQANHLAQVNQLEGSLIGQKTVIPVSLGGETLATIYVEGKRVAVREGRD